MSFLVELPLHRYPASAFDGFSNAPDFSLGNARAMMWMAQLAYEVRDARQKVEPILARWDLGLIDLLEHEERGILPRTSTRGIVAAGRGAVMISFAGTDPLALANLITNVTLGPRARMMHRGFEEAVDAVWTNIVEPLQSPPLSGLPLFVTGHSLGAALAIICAERLARRKQRTATAIYAFGAPRVGNAAFAAAYHACGLGLRTYRLIHGSDMVPTLPPSTLGFRHVGRRVSCARGKHFTADTLAKTEDDTPPFVATVRQGYRRRLIDIAAGRAIRSSRNGLLGWYQTYLVSPVLGDHLPERYRKALD